MNSYIEEFSKELDEKYHININGAKIQKIH